MPDLDDLQAMRRRAFGTKLRALRVAAGLSQEKLGRAAGLERAYVGHLENGRRNISLHTMWQLADALQVTPAEFFTRTSTGTSADGSHGRGEPAGKGA